MTSASQPGPKPMPSRPGGPLTLVFDLDGTLVDSAPDLMATLNVLLVREGAAPLPVEAAGSLVGAGARALLERGFAVDGRTVPPGHMDDLFADFLDHYGEHLADQTRPFPGVETVLQRCQAAGHILAVCTNKTTDHSRRLLGLLGLDRSFQAICGRDAFAYAKPDPRHLQLTIRQAGGTPDRAVMIGDSKTDIATALAAGIPSICVSFGYTDIAPRELGADIVIDHYDEFDAALECIEAGLQTRAQATPKALPTP